MAAEPRKTRQPEYLWHHSLHRRRASERLYYWQISFNPSYDQKIFLTHVRGALRDIGVLSYTVWELFGEHDFLLRAWIPADVDVTAVREVLKESVKRPNSAVVDSGFSVEAILHHWMWPDTIDVSQAAGEIDPRHMAQLNSDDVVPMSARRHYLDQHYICRIKRLQSMKFFMRITDTPTKSELYDEDEFKRLLLEAVRTSEGVSAPALYEGQGWGSRYLIAGRVALSRVEHLSTALTEQINRLGYHQLRGVRTYTKLSSFFNPIAQREQLLPYVKPSRDEFEDHIDIRALLERDEDRTLEFKGSAFVDVGNAVHSGTRRASSERGRDVAKAVVGLLNAVGGLVVVGVLEDIHFNSDQLQAAGFPHITVGQHHFIGVDFEVSSKKGHDEYERRLYAAISSQIKPRPDPWFALKRVQIGPHTGYAVIIRRPDTWFYAHFKGTDESQQRFFARVGNETKPYFGSEIDRYQSANPRTTAYSNVT